MANDVVIKAFRISVAAREAINQLADRENRTVAGQIRTMLEEALRAKGHLKDDQA